MSAAKEVFAQNGYYLASAQPDEAYKNLVRQAYARSQEVSKSGDEKLRNWGYADGTFKHFMNPHVNDEVFDQLVRSEVVVSHLKDFFANHPMFITHSKISFKAPGKAHLWLPHQDFGYKRKDVVGCTIAIYLEDCDEHNGTLELYPQSHLLGGLKHKRIQVAGESMPQLCLEDTLPMKAAPIPGKAGDILFFDLKMVHQSGANNSQGNRPILIFEVETLEGLALDDAFRPAAVLVGKYPAWKAIVGATASKVVLTAKAVARYLRDLLKSKKFASR